MTLRELGDFSFPLASAWIPARDHAVFPVSSGQSDKHQVEMLEAISENEADAIINTNPTGGGKTLSWVAPVVRSEGTDEPLAALATFPTRALIYDQRTLILEYFRRYFASDWAPDWSVEPTNGPLADTDIVHKPTEKYYSLSARVRIVTGADLRDASGTFTGLQSVENALVNAASEGMPTVVLTTPDTLTLLASNRYRQSDMGAIPSLFDLIVVDEFHLTGSRGKRLLPFHLDTYLTLGQGHLNQLVFLSATPNSSVTDRIERAFDTQYVTREVTATAPSPGRQIMPPVELNITNRDLFQAGTWLANQTDAIAEAVAPPGQTLIIVDSVREVELVAEQLQQQTSYDVGRIYGWKKEGRAATISQADVVVGNTAVEVGVDFDRINRLIFTAHGPNSAIQRLGRMRPRSDLDDYRALCITTPSTQDALYQHTSDQPLSRPRIEQVFTDTLPNPGTKLPFDMLCAAYTRYLWSEADQPLASEFPPRARPHYRSTVHTHFAPEVQQLYGESFTIDELWSRLEESSYANRTSVMKELHTYRSSSLQCLVIDAQDSEEPLKQYSLQHVLRYRDGEIIPVDDTEESFEAIIGRPPTADEQQFIDTVRKRVECGFVVTGRKDTSRDVAAHAFRWNPDEQELRSVSELRIDVSPRIAGLEHLSPLDSNVLVQYVPDPPKKAKSRYNVGPYANLLPYRDGTVFLWEDALIAHSEIVAERIPDK